MRIMNDEIWLEIPELTGLGMFTERTLRRYLERGSAIWQSVQDPQDLRITLVRYNTLDSKYKNAFTDKYTYGEHPLDFIRKADQETLQVGIEGKLKEACEFGFNQYMGQYRNLKTEDTRKKKRQQTCLARAAACLVVIKDHFDQTGQAYNKIKAFEPACAWLEKNEREFFPLKYLPTNPRKLSEKLRAYAEDLTPLNEVINLPRSGNENRKGESHTFAQGAVARLAIEGKNTTDASIIRKVQFACLKKGIKAPSESTVRRHIAETMSKTALKRYGVENKASARFRTSTPLAHAMNAGDCWEMDGTRVQIQPYNESGQLLYLYVVGVRDVYSGMFLGWSFGLSESELMYREALKMAVTIAGYLPFELRHDKFPGHNTPEMEALLTEINQRGTKLTKTSSAQGKAKIERAFGTLQSVFEMDRKEWVGQGIKSSRQYNRPTQEYLSKVHKQLKSEGFDWEAAWRVENDVIMLYNNTPLSLYSRKFKTITQSPAEMHETDTDKPHVFTQEVYEIAELFWASKKIAISNAGQIKITKNRTEYTYNLRTVEYADILRSYHEVIVRYEASSMEEIMIFCPTSGNLLGTVKTFEPIQMYGPNAEYARLAEYKTKSKEVQTILKNDLNDILDQCTDDVLSLSLGAMISKDQQAAAETSVQARYWTNQVPVRPLPKKTTTKKSLDKKPVAELNAQPIDAMTYLLNQL